VVSAKGESGGKKGVTYGNKPTPNYKWRAGEKKKKVLSNCSSILLRKKEKNSDQIVRGTEKGAAARRPGTEGPSERLNMLREVDRALRRRLRG